MRHIPSPALCLVVLALALVLTACGPAPTPTPTPDMQATVAAVVQATITSAATDLQREAMLTFTRQALQIEAERAELMGYFASLEGSYAQGWRASQFFLKGVPVGTYPSPSHDLAGMSSLSERLFLLDSPQSMHAVKDALIYIYNSEIQQFYLGKVMMALDATAKDLEAHIKDPKGFGGLGGSPALLLQYIDPEVTKDNLDYWKQKVTDSPSGSYYQRYYQRKVDGPWGQLQALRLDVYVKWAQLLREHGIDPAKEGFTSLVQQ